ncbi:MAG: M16 family metallopeptidase [Minisyncoccota bacterium]
MNTPEFDLYHFSKKDVSGIPVYYKNIPSAPCINIRLVFNTGAFNDPVGKEGLTHFLEHLFFNGSPSLPDKKTIKNWKKVNVFNSMNAHTSFSSVWLSTKCFPEKFEKVLEGIKDMVFYPFLRSEDIEHERKVITQEAWNRFNNEKYLNYIKEVKSILSPNHDLGRFNTPLGWPDVIERIKQEDLVEWHKLICGIGNFFIVLTGAIDDSHVKKLNSFAEGLPNVKPLQTRSGVLSKPTQTKLVKNADDIGEIKEQVEISFVRVSKEIDLYEKKELLKVSRALLGDILVEKLRTENSLCYGVATNFIWDRSYSLFAINLKTEESKVEIVEKKVKECIEEIVDGKALDRFNTVKQTVLEQFESEEALSDTVANMAMWDILLTNDVITKKETLQNLLKIQYEDVITFVKETFNEDYILTEIILSSKK